jgi:hypothetical protein
MRDYRRRKAAPDPRDLRIAELEAEVGRLTAALETWRIVLEGAPAVRDEARTMSEQIMGRETPREEHAPHGQAEGFIHFGRPAPAPKPVPRGGRSRSGPR